MNYSTAIFLINPKVRAIACIYEPDTDTKKFPRVIFKTFDQGIRVNDYVLVPTETRHRMTVNKVVEVDVEPDLETSAEMHWIIGVIDRSDYERTLADEGRAIKLMKDAEKTHKRTELRDKMLAHVDPAAIEALRIAKQSDVIEQRSDTPPEPR
jgi:hypothetical protein